MVSNGWIRDQQGKFNLEMKFGLRICTNRWFRFRDNEYYDGVTEELYLSRMENQDKMQNKIDIQRENESMISS